MLEWSYLGGIIGYAVLFCANPIQWHRILKRQSVGDISLAWVTLPVIANFFMGFTSNQHIIWLIGNMLILVSCIMTAILVGYVKWMSKKPEWWGLPCLKN